MKNKILAIFHSSVPYIKELRNLPNVKSVSTCVLMQQLDYWFARSGQGFWKFNAPCSHPHYQAGDSWEEEMGFSRHELQTAFKNIGVRYQSKKAWEKAPDKFQGKYYCCYHDRLSRLTFYFRNDELLDSYLDNLCRGLPNWQSEKPATPTAENSHRTECEKPAPDLQRVDYSEKKDNFSFFQPAKENQPTPSFMGVKQKEEIPTESVERQTEQDQAGRENFATGEKYTPPHLKDKGDRHITAMEEHFNKGGQTPMWSTGQKIDGKWFKVKPEFSKWLQEGMGVSALFVQNYANKRVEQFEEEYQRFLKKEPYNPNEKKKQPSSFDYVERKEAPKLHDRVPEIPKGFDEWFHVPYLLGARIKYNNDKGCFVLTGEKGVLPREIKSLGLKNNEPIDHALEKLPTFEALRAKFQELGPIYEVVRREIANYFQKPEWIEKTKLHLEAQYELAMGVVPC